MSCNKWRFDVSDRETHRKLLYPVQISTLNWMYWMEITHFEYVFWKQINAPIFLAYSCASFVVIPTYSFVCVCVHRIYLFESIWIYHPFLLSLFCHISFSYFVSIAFHHASQLGDCPHQRWSKRWKNNWNWTVFQPKYYRIEKNHWESSTSSLYSCLFVCLA